MCQQLNYNRDQITQPRPDYTTAALSSNTRRAYAFDLKHYSQSGYRPPAKPKELMD